MARIRQNIDREWSQSCLKTISKLTYEWNLEWFTKCKEQYEFSCKTSKTKNYSSWLKQGKILISKWIL